MISYFLVTRLPKNTKVGRFLRHSVLPVLWMTSRLPIITQAKAALMVGMPPSCAPLGGFAIGAGVALLWQHNVNAKC